MTARPATRESARTIGIALLFAGAWFVAMAVATSVEDGGLVPLSDEALSLELPEHCTASRSLSGIAISCDDLETPAQARAPLAFEESDGSALAAAAAAQFETAMQ
jgi:hypothetical protein